MGQKASRNRLSNVLDMGYLLLAKIAWHFCWDWFRLSGRHVWQQLGSHRFYGGQQTVCGEGDT